MLYEISCLHAYTVHGGEICTTTVTLLHLQMPVIVTASNNMNDSVMITGIREFQNRNRRGATMRMNSDGVRLVCALTLMHLYSAEC